MCPSPLIIFASQDNWSGNLTQLQYLPAPLIFADAQRDDDDYDCDAAVNSIHSLHVVLGPSTLKKITENAMAEASAKAAAAAPAKKGDRRASRKSSIFTKARMSFVR